MPPILTIIDPEKTYKRLTGPMTSMFKLDKPLFRGIVAGEFERTLDLYFTNGINAAGAFQKIVSLDEVELTRDADNTLADDQPFIRSENKQYSSKWRLDINLKDFAFNSGENHAFIGIVNTKLLEADWSNDIAGGLNVQIGFHIFHDGVDKKVEFWYADPDTGAVTNLFADDITLADGADFLVRIDKLQEDYSFVFDVNDDLGPGTITKTISRDLVKKNVDEYFMGMLASLSTGDIISTKFVSPSWQSVSNDFSDLATGTVADGAISITQTTSKRFEGAIMDEVLESQEYLEAAEKSLLLDDATGDFLVEWAKLFGVPIEPTDTEQDTINKIKSLVLFGSGTTEDLEDKITFLTGQVSFVIDIPEDEAFADNCFADINFNSEIADEIHGSSPPFYSLSWAAGTGGHNLIVLVPNLIDLVYIGAGTAAVLNISDTDLQTDITGAPADNLDLDFADFPNVEDIVNEINTNFGATYTATLIIPDGKTNSSEMERRTGSDIKTSAFTVLTHLDFAQIQGIIDENVAAGTPFDFIFLIGT